jgi:hypothetical protein
MADASCPGPSDLAITYSPGSARLAQTFTAQNTGTLTRTRLPVIKPNGSTSGDWIVQILTTDGAGSPTNNILASAIVTDQTVLTSTSVSSPVTEVDAVFATPANVTAGQQYALSLTRPASDQFGARFRNSDACPGSYFKSAAQPPTLFAADNPNYDMLFAVFVTTPPPPPDTAPPQTTLGKHPKKNTTKTTATFTFFSDEAGSSFQCKLDKKPFKPCGSPRRYQHLRLGKHVFRVASADAAGNLDPSPALYKWRVLP